MTGNMTRRRFLKSGCLVLAAVSVSGALTIVNVSSAEAGMDSTFKPHAFLEIAPDGSVTVWVGQTNLGQGTHTGIPMIIADELDADWNTVGVKMALAADVFKDPIWGVQVTGGSTSIRHRWDLLRKVGAGARIMLMQAAADRWGIDASKCSTRTGKVYAPDGKSLEYGELTAEASRLEAPKEPPLKSREDYVIMGTRRQRLDIVDKVQGKTVFGLDVQMPDMLVAVMDRPPRYGATPQSYDEKAALAVTGVEKVLPLDDKIAVYATNTYAALKGRDALVTKWSKGSHPDLSDKSIMELMQRKMSKPGAIAQSIGDTDKALSDAAIKVEAAYSVPYMAHAQLEPSNCTALVEPNRCRIWVPIQAQTASLKDAARITGLPEDKIELMTMPCGGGFGRRLESDVVAETVALAKDMGRPVKLMWTREDEFANDFYRPASICEIKGGLDAEGNLVAWRHKLASQSIMSRLQPDAVKNGVDNSSLMGVPDMPYDMPNRLVEYALIDLPIRVGWLRSVAYSYNAFTVESFMDELAAKAGKDPVAFRLALLKKDSRSYKVLTALAEKCDWGNPPPLGRGRGIALCRCFESVAAHMSEVSVDKATGMVTVHRVVGVVDCGTSVYPDGIEAQMEGGVIIGTSMAFNEAVSFADGGVATSNYSNYPLLSMTQIPSIETYMVDSGAKAGGIGEPSVPSVAPSIANAIYAATGVRLRDLPFKFEALKST